MTTMNGQTLKVAIYTDGMGTWQARCMDCAWRSDWFARESTAVKHAKSHQHGDYNGDSLRVGFSDSPSNRAVDLGRHGSTPVELYERGEL